MVLTKREKTCIEMASLAEALNDLDEYGSPEDRLELLPIDVAYAKTYWAQSKIDTRIRKLKAALVRAKAARYDVIAQRYDQLCMDFSEPTSEDPEWTTSEPYAPEDLPF